MPSKRLPKLCRHKRTNRAYVTDPATGHEHYLGIWGTTEAQQNYGRWIQQLIARRQQVPSGAPPGSCLSVGQLIADYMAWAKTYYLKDGAQTSEIHALRQALRLTNELFGAIDADRFGPTELKAVREQMVQRGWARRSINKHVQRIRRLFRWGVEHELVRPQTLEALKAVPGLRRGRTPARETGPVAPVPLDVLEAVLQRLDPVVRSMCEIQLHADMRPGELVIMRPCDIDRRETPWLYVPRKHKTEHHGKERKIFLGPQAREILAPLILKCPSENAWLFPSRAVGKHAARRTHWTVSGIRKAIKKVCEKEPVLPAFHPNQIRHTQSTYIRKHFGIEAAQVILGHSQLSTSEIYAEKNENLAREIVEKIG